MNRRQNGERSDPPQAEWANTDHSDDELVRAFQAARRDRRRAVLEGLHPLKHALRFGADIEAVVSPDRDALIALARDLAPDLVPFAHKIREVPPDVFERLSPASVNDVIALAEQPDTSTTRAHAAAGRPWVLLEAPTHLGNVGAVVRVCAAANAAAVLTTGPHNPWHPAALRGSAGLHFALPVLGLDGTDAALAAAPADHPIIAIDPDGEPLDHIGGLPSGSLLAFGSERRGLSASLLERARHRIRIPMRPGVSSLNLATAVAIVLYTAFPPASESGARPDATTP